MDDKIKKAGWLNTVIALMALGAGLGTMLASRTGSMPAPVTCFVLALLLIGFLVALVSAFHLHLLDREQMEQLEHEELTSGSADSSMFESDAFAARRTREQFDRWMVPVFTGLLLLLQGGGAWWLARVNPRFNDFSDTQGLEGSGVVVAISAVFGMFLFLRGRYATLLSRMGNRMILQPGSDFLLLGAYLFFLQAAVSAAALMEYHLVHQYLATGLCIFMGVLALETLLRLILDIYRPRMKGQEVRQLYHSRLVGLISKPEGFFATAAHALDYQFGFKVSETWGYQFLRERLGLIVLLQGFVLWISSSVVIIPQSQVGYLERNGVPIDARGPGISFKLPWPIDRVERHFEDEVRMLYIGPALNPRLLGGRSYFWYDDENEQMVDPRLAPPGPQFNSLWTEPNVRDYDKHLIRKKLYRTFFATREAGGDGQALIHAGVFEQFRISDVKQYANFAERPEEVLEKLVTREMTRHFMKTDIWSILTSERGDLAESIRLEVQQQVDDHGLGLKVLNVGLNGLQPPAEMAVLAKKNNDDPTQTEEEDATSPAQQFEEYFQSRIRQQGMLRMSQLHSNSLTHLARIAKTNLVTLGRLEADNILRKARAETDREGEFMELYEKSPRVFPAFQLIDARTNYIGSIRSKIVLIGVDAEGFEVDLKQGDGGLLESGSRVPLNTGQ